MKRKLLRQILNEWTSNLWLAIELLIVSVVMWWLCDQLWVSEAVYREPLGFDYSHCYRIEVDELTPQSPDFKQYTDREARIDDFIELMRRLEARPEIEAAGNGVNSYFYNHSNSGIALCIDTLRADGWVVKRLVTPGFIKVFRICGANGETPEQLAEILAKSPSSSFMAPDNMFRNKYGIQSMRDFVGKTFYEDMDSSALALTATYKPLRYSDFQSMYGSETSVIMPILSKGHMGYINETVVRVKENMDKDFAERLMLDANDRLRVGNWYISSVDSFDEIRRTFIMGDTQKRINLIAGSLFLLLNIFLGVLGTFWFRTSQRTREIALRVANGATRRDIFRRVVSEGLVILLAVTPIAGVIDWLLTHYELNAFYMGTFFQPTRFFGCIILVVALISFIILIGSCIPAMKAMKISPAEALKTE